MSRDILKMSSWGLKVGTNDRNVRKNKKYKHYFQMFLIHTSVAFICFSHILKSKPPLQEDT